MAETSSGSEGLEVPKTKEGKSVQVTSKKTAGSCFIPKTHAIGLVVKRMTSKRQQGQGGRARRKNFKGTNGRRGKERGLTYTTVAVNRGRVMRWIEPC